MTAVAAHHFDLVAVPPANFDRRALSQAWYDALHLAGSNARERTRTLEPVRAYDRAPARAPARISRGASRAVAPAVRAPLRVAPVFAADRRAAPSALARRIVARLRARTAHAGTRPNVHAATSFSIVTPRGRVHVAIARAGSRIRLFAFCRPELREEVEAALAQARFALAGAGMAVAW